MMKLGHMVLKGVICVHNVKIWSSGLERNQLGKQHKNQGIWSWKQSICYRMQKSGWLSKLGTQCKNQFIWSWKELIGYTLIKLGQIVLKGVNCGHNDKFGQMVLKGVNLVHNDKIRSNGLERSNFCTQCKNQIKWSWKESIGYTIQKSGHMVLKGVIWFEMSNLVHNTNFRSNGLERSQLCTQ